jgi:hypothetical protein
MPRLGPVQPTQAQLEPRQLGRTQVALEAVVKQAKRAVTQKVR